MDSWTCIAVQSNQGVISDAVRNVLKAAACELQLRRCDEMRIENGEVSGVIKTEWKTHTVGSRAGVLFHTHFDCSAGIDCKVNFLFNAEDLAKGAEILRQLAETEGEWSDAPFTIPIPALYQFQDLRGPSRRVH